MFGMMHIHCKYQLLNPTLGYVGDDKNLFALDALQDTYALVIYNIKLPTGRQASF